MPQQTIELEDQLAEVVTGDLSGDLNDENLDGRQTAFGACRSFSIGRGT